MLLRYRGKYWEQYREKNTKSIKKHGSSFSSQYSPNSMDNIKMIQSKKGLKNANIS